MRPKRFDLSQLGRLLGTRDEPEGRDDPPVVWQVQPVMIAGDRSAHVSKTRVPWGYSQAYIDPVTLGAKFAGCMFTCKAKGGADLQFSFSQAVGASFSVFNAFPYASFDFYDATPSNVTVSATPSIVTPDTQFLPQSIVSACFNTGAPPVQPAKNNRPLVFGGMFAADGVAAKYVLTSDSPGEVLWFYVPAGRTFYAEAYTAGVDTVFNLRWFEYQAASPSA